jgi:hypothetical protein
MRTRHFLAVVSPSVNFTVTPPLSLRPIRSGYKASSVSFYVVYIGLRSFVNSAGRRSSGHSREMLLCLRAIRLLCAHCFVGRRAFCGEMTLDVRGQLGRLKVKGRNKCLFEGSTLGLGNCGYAVPAGLSLSGAWGPGVWDLAWVNYDVQLIF